MRETISNAVILALFGGSNGRATMARRVNLEAQLRLRLLQWAIRNARERVIRAIVWKLPHSVIYWAGIRIWANATTGRYGRVEAPAVTCTDAVEAWHNRMGGDFER